MKQISIKSITLTGVFAAVCALLSQIYLPVPWSIVPVTLQTFAVMLSGFCQTPKSSIITMVTYIALGAVGAPVFSGFRGGFSVLLGPVGGFIWGFIILSLFCALACRYKKPCGKLSLAAVGLVICHLLGVVQYSVVTNVSIFASFMVASLPFILKDAFLGAAAYMVSLRVKNRW